METKTFKATDWMLLAVLLGMLFGIGIWGRGLSSSLASASSGAAPREVPPVSDPAR